jgi:hypothetical protein
MPDYQSFRGDTFVILAQVLQVPSGLPYGSQPVPTNVTGWTFWFTVKRYYADPDVLAVSQAITTDSTGNMTITDAVNGKVTAILPALATLNFPDSPTKLIYDIQGKDGLGKVYTIDSGSITVVPDVTRALS